KQLVILQAVGFHLLSALMAGEGSQDVIAREAATDLAEQRLQRRPDAAFPVDQRAVAIEAQYFKVAEPHLSSGSCHCERSEAISRRHARPAGDCFVALLLAMTYPL